MSQFPLGQPAPHRFMVGRHPSRSWDPAPGSPTVALPFASAESLLPSLPRASALCPCCMMAPQTYCALLPCLLVTPWTVLFLQLCSLLFNTSFSVHVILSLPPVIPISTHTLPNWHISHAELGKWWLTEQGSFYSSDKWVWFLWCRRINFLHLAVPASIVEASKPHCAHFQDAHWELTTFFEGFNKKTGLRDYYARQDQGQLETCRPAHAGRASTSAMLGGDCENFLRNSQHFQLHM